jgi:hypothetical protein
MCGVSTLNSDVNSMNFRILIVFTIISLGAYSQSIPIISPEVFASAGNFDTLQNNTSFSWSIGETITETSSLNTDYVVITQGFQQPLWTNLSSGTDNHENFNNICYIYPNPTHDFIQIVFSDNNFNHLNIKLYDMFGKILLNKQVTAGKISELMDLTIFASSFFLLQVINNDGNRIKSYIIIKI